MHTHKKKSIPTLQAAAFNVRLSSLLCCTSRQLKHLYSFKRGRGGGGWEEQKKKIKIRILKVTAAHANETARRGVAVLPAYYARSRDPVASVLFDANYAAGTHVAARGRRHRRVFGVRSRPWLLYRRLLWWLAENKDPWGLSAQANVRQRPQRTIGYWPSTFNRASSRTLPVWRRDVLCHCHCSADDFYAGLFSSSSSLFPGCTFKNRTFTDQMQQPC